jgi:hypothetical protein
MRVNVLGTEYKIIKKRYDEDECFEKFCWNGYCQEDTKEIVICDIGTYPDCEHFTKKERIKAERMCLRHEIVHAFLNESGLSASSLNYSGGWAKNEEMVDWFAIQGGKIFDAWLRAEAVYFAPKVEG